MKQTSYIFIGILLVILVASFLYPKLCFEAKDHPIWDDVEQLDSVVAESDTVLVDTIAIDSVM